MNIRLIFRFGLGFSFVFVALNSSMANQPYQIMPLGDSITEGLGAPGGYRLQLYQDLLGAGYAFIFVGSQSDNSDSSGILAAAGQTSHEGHGGYRTDSITGDLDGNNNFANTSNGGYWLTGGHGTGRGPLTPDIILLEIGTNDAAQGESLATMENDTSTLLGTLKSYCPNAQVFVANLIPRSDSLESVIEQFNSDLPALVNQEGSHFHLVDMFSHLTTSDLSDNVHPNQQGYNIMADVWASAIEQAIPALSSTVDTAQAPAGLTAQGSSGVVALSWIGSIYASSYTIQRSTASGSGYVTIGTSVTGSSYSDTNVSNGVTYYYLVTGSNAAGAGAWAPASATPQIIADAGFESPVVPSYTYDLSGSPWTFSGSSPSGTGITTNNSPFTDFNGPAPEGTQVAFLQETGSFSQQLNGLIPGMTYSLTFSAAQRWGYLQTWDVTMNGQVIASYNPASSVSTYTDYTATFTAVTPSETLAFVGTDLNGGDNTVFIDNLRISSPSPIPVPPPLVGNGGFETPAISTFEFAPAAGTWTFFGASPSGSGISANDSAFSATTGSAPEGTQVAFVEETGSFSQLLNNLVPGETYTLSFLAAQQATNNNGGQTWNVTMDGTTVASYAPLQSASTYATYTALLTATATSETLAFLGTDTRGGDNIILIDNVNLSAPVPAAPTGLTPTYLSETQLLLTWVDNASNATGYIVERSPAGANQWTVLTNALPPGTTSYQDNELSPSTSYDYVVMAVGPASYSGADAVTVTTPAGVGDGIPGWWRLNYFGNGLSAAGAAAANADPDGDGMTNYQEYLAGTDPTNPLSAFQITGITPSGNDMVITFPSVLGNFYELQKTISLGTSVSWTRLGNNIEGTGNPISIPDPGAASQPAGFYQVIVNPP
jgi:lysophospholipase L1-like esterase